LKKNPLPGLRIGIFGAKIALKISHFLRFSKNGFLKD
jgi:hypothetical protein